MPNSQTPSLTAAWTGATSSPLPPKLGMGCPLPLSAEPDGTLLHPPQSLDCVHQPDPAHRQTRNCPSSPLGKKTAIPRSSNTGLEELISRRGVPKQQPALQRRLYPCSQTPSPPPVWADRAAGASKEFFKSLKQEPLNSHIG
ncbi:hypothetical protein Y1Q_0020022 [Alligator mississippiensis]|uniref:Uncharacterized protein n=1 Tax=Alligator mississippiensis TaxID=8496 RepID=A0A151LYP5_ALLMI|nr:hypothetical protein Y1Q_0020022 [Alligator mississippiensis]